MTTSTQRQPTTRSYPTMPERIEALATERRLLAQPDGSYLVESSQRGEYHKVTAEQCGCPSFQRRGIGPLHGLRKARLKVGIRPDRGVRHAQQLGVRRLDFGWPAEAHQGGGDLLDVGHARRFTSTVIEAQQLLWRHPEVWRQLRQGAHARLGFACL